MTKSELIRAVAERMPHLPARDLEVVVNTIFDTMTDALRIGDRIEIRGFGSFTVRNRRSRTGRNPKTGETIHVPAKRVPFFTVGHELRQRVDEGRTGAKAAQSEAGDERSESRPLQTGKSPTSVEAYSAAPGEGWQSS